MTKKALAFLSWSLNADCPHCGVEVDLVDYDSENEYRIANKVFKNDWGSLKGHEVTCPHCKQEFELEKLEY